MNPENHHQFLALYQPLHERFTRYCSSNAYGLMETEDLVQETILATLGNFHRINDKNKLLYYMISTANNIVKNLLRRKKFAGAYDEKAMLTMEGQSDNPEVALDVHFLYKALNQLSEKDKQAIILFEVSGFSIREISEILVSSEGAIKTRLSRARQKLKEWLQEDMPRAGVKTKSATLFSLML